MASAPAPAGPQRPTALLAWLRRERAEREGPLTIVLLGHGRLPPGGAAPSPRGTGSAQVVIEGPPHLSRVPAAAFLEIALTAGHLRVTEWTEAAQEAAAVLAVLTAASSWDGVASIEQWRAPRAQGGHRVRPIRWDAPPLPRRLLFGRSDAPQAPHLDPGGSDSTWMHAVITQQLELLQPEERAEALAQLRRVPRSGSRVQASAACAGTGTCVRTCPADALVLTRSEGTFALDLLGSACIECGLCADFCPEEALTLSEDADWSDGASRRLRVGQLRRCRSCRTPHGRAGELCAPCAFRQENPTGHRLPPGFVRPRDRPPRTHSDS